MPRWNVGRRPTNSGIRVSFHGICRHLDQTPSDLYQELLSADTRGFKCFQCHWKKVVCAAEWAVLVSFSDSCSLSGTGTGDGTLLQISVSQSVDYCDVPSGAAPGVPWQQCQALRPLAVVTDQPVWFLHAGNAGSSQSAPDDSNAVGVLQGCCPSSSVVLCNECIVTKQCKVGLRLLLITNRKSNTGFQMTLKSMTLDDL